MDNKYKNIGLIGRFKPPHRGHMSMLEKMCEAAEHVVIGIGSANKYDDRNPFYPQETEEMIDAVLSKNYDNYEFVRINDEDNNENAWKENVLTNFGSLDYFVSGNEWVNDLLKDNYQILQPTEFVSLDTFVNIDATTVRTKIILDDNSYKTHLNDEVVDYLEQRPQLLERFRDDFGYTVKEKIMDGSYISLNTRDDQVAERTQIKNYA